MNLPEPLLRIFPMPGDDSYTHCVAITSSRETSAADCAHALPKFSINAQVPMIHTFFTVLTPS